MDPTMEGRLERLRRPAFHRSPLTNKQPSYTERFTDPDPDTNTFGSFTPDGKAKTLFKPTSKSYWDRQPGVLQ